MSTPENENHRESEPRGTASPADPPETLQTAERGAGEFGAEIREESSPPKRRGLLVFSCLAVTLILLALLAGAVFLAVSSVSSFIGGSGAASGRWPAALSAGDIGLVRIEGVIAGRTSEAALQTIDHYSENDDVRAVLVRIDSPGGTVGDSQEIYQALRNLREQGKPVVVSLGNTAASGGYYVACAAQRILTNPGTLTGSIGVILQVPNMKALGEKIGVDVTVVKSGDLKDVPSPVRHLTEEERRYLQIVIDDTYEQFYEAVLTSRREALEAAFQKFPANAPRIAETVAPAASATVEDFLREIADGRVLTGRQAVALGLADAPGTMSDAVDALAQIAGLSDPEVYEYRPPQTLLDLLGGGAHAMLDQTGLSRLGARLEYRMTF